jgi:large subunit ribosomal protein L9
MRISAIEARKRRDFMKVILADDVRGLGHRGDTVTVKPGYARNYLFPQGFAYEATGANLRRLGEEKKKYDEKTLHERVGAEAVAKQIEGMTVVIMKKAGEEDTLYGSVTPAEIADALAQRGIQVDRRRIELAEPIKRLGEHRVHVRLHRDVTTELIVDVQPVAPVTA